MKYIVTENLKGEEEIFLFPDSVNHDCMAAEIRRLKNQFSGNWQRIRRNPIFAGFVTPSGKCTGKSESLGLESRPEADTALLQATYR